MELLAPAGSPEALRAAVQNGADAVYLGWGRFNARQSARNFSDEEFREALAYCHTYGVRVFLTLNTLLTDRELPKALETAASAARLGVDAVLVQDWGLFDLLRKSLPDLPLHASTQMSVFTSGGAIQLAEDGCERVVLARECSGEDTARVCENCPAEIEVFVHGALCVCCSGQCAFSAVVGGRSGNRGRCAQPCRLPYGVNEPAGNKRPLSLKDNCLAEYLQEMEDMGVACLKLEGRMKRPEYVAVVTRIYARLLAEHRPPTAAERAELDQAFSRSGFTDWYWRGKTGYPMFGARPENIPEPAALFQEARASYEKDGLRTVPAAFACTVRAGEPCTLAVRDRDGHTVTVSGPVPETAGNRALTEEDLRSRLSKTGGTPYRCEEISLAIDSGLYLSASALNGLRRSALSALTEARTAPPARRELPPPPLPEAGCAGDAPEWTVSVVNLAQASPELLALGPSRVYVPLEQLADCAALPEYGGEWCAVPPRVWRDRDEGRLRDWLDRAKALGAAGALLGNIGHLPLLRDSGLALYGDFGLNVFNSRSLAYLREKGLASACLAFELRFAQIRDMEKFLPAEAIVYGRLPLMLTENCLIRNNGGCRCDLPNFLNDRTGASFPLLPAFGHRTELQNSKVLWLADKPQWQRAGLRYARLRFTTETPETCLEVFHAYLRQEPPQGEFTRGLYERGVE